jgi:1-acyl-sn-glycerol-3-phosphate acyltransferase
MMPHPARASKFATMRAMFARLPAILRVPLVWLLIVASTVLHVLPLLAVALLRWLLPGAAGRACGRALVRMAESWIGVNAALVRGFTTTRLHVEGGEGLRNDGHYLVLANHQSWVDIIVLQTVLNRRMPFMRFFLKRQLIWVPLLGLAWWALDFPFMRRASRRELAKRPELARRDMEATRRACEKFRGMPVAIMNFVEGTRFTPAKHARQASPYAHLLKPKAGGVGFTLEAMDGALHSVVDVAIAYPAGVPTLLDLVAGRIPEVRLRIRERAIPAPLQGIPYEADPQARASVQRWINGMWVEKDADLGELLAAPATARAGAG